jgi:hypothetical protein
VSVCPRCFPLCLEAKTDTIAFTYLLKLTVAVRLQEFHIATTVNELILIKFTIEKQGSRDSAVGIATGCGLDGRGVRFRVPVRVRTFSMSSMSALESTQSPIQRVPGAISVTVKRSRRKADYSPPVSAEVKKICIYTPTPPYAFIA